MKYRIDKKIMRMEAKEEPAQGKTIVEVLTREEYENLYHEHLHDKLLLRSLDYYQYCKADLLQGCTIGTFVIPDKSDLINQVICFGYYIDNKRLIFVDDSNTVNDIIEDIVKLQIMETTSVAHFLFEFLEYLVRNEVQYLQNYEKQMTELEEALMGDGRDEIPGLILKRRKELLHLNGYYNQLIDMSETLKENYNNLLNAEESNLFHLFSGRVARLSANTQSLREFALQILEMYQTQINIRQNQVMKFLTVVTTVFMPLTLITGWYGMNFKTMPELHAKGGYLSIILISLAIIGIECWLFKKKKWFK